MYSVERVRFALALGGLLFCSTALAQKHVYVSAITGSDSNDGLTPESPLKTISAAFPKVSTGDTVTIGPGEYDEQLVDPPGGTADQSRVTYQASSYDSRPVIKPSSGIRPLTVRTKYLTFAGLIFDGSACQYDAAKVTSGAIGFARYVSFDRCVFRGGKDQGLLVTGAASGVSHVDVTNCEAHSNGDTRHDHGIYVSVDHVRIAHCDVHDNAGWGIHCYSEPAAVAQSYAVRGPSHLVIEHNRCERNGSIDGTGRGIGIYDGDWIELQHNVIDGNARLPMVSGCRWVTFE